ncbi:MAG: GntR family transcriptional regulator [Armatimonadota bacterium]|nr:GntR family transcriptional regulator [Armatimonadota bacterium]
MSRFLTIQESIARDLRERIVTGQLAPGSRLIIEDLAAQFGVSPMPVREALRQLSAEGLVVAHSYRGATVSELSVQEIQEIFLMRQLLEGEAASLGVRRLTGDDDRRLRTLMDEMRESTRDPSRWIPADRRFHMTIYRASGYDRLVQLIEHLRQHIERYVRLYITLERNIPLSMECHQEILEACLRRDARRARSVTVAHLRETAGMFIEQLERREADLATMRASAASKTPVTGGTR